MRLWDFLLLQADKINRGDLRALAGDFEIPFVVTHGRDAWLILSEDELVRHLERIADHLRELGFARIERQHRRFQAAMEVMTMVSFKDVFWGTDNSTIGSIDFTYAVQNRSETPSISILMIDSVSDELWRSGLTLEYQGGETRKLREA